jgi:glycosyltransferase involved in cell wall biosynthesis/HEAT repeat protein
MDVGAALAAVRSSGTILEGLRAGERLQDAARGGPPGAADLLVAATADADPITAVAAVRALGAHGGAQAADHLVALLADHRPHVAEHAVEALGDVGPRPAGIPDLVRRCAQGGFAGMLAQRTLERWAVTAPDAVHAGLAAAMRFEREPEARMRLVETVGLVPRRASLSLLTQVASDDGEAADVRAAALSGLGDLLTEPGCRVVPEAAPARAALDCVAKTGGSAGPDGSPGSEGSVRSLAQAATLALSDAFATPGAGGGHNGLTVVQLFLHGDVDGTLRHSGQGDTGGIATLLVHLGDALLRQGRRVQRVITVSGGWGDVSAVGSTVVDTSASATTASAPMAGAWKAGPATARGSVAAGTPGVPTTAAHAPAGHSLADDLSPAGHLYARVPLRGHSTGASTAWPRRVEARRGIRRVLRAAGHVDVVHLRMADVGSMAAAEVAAELGIPVVLTVAPDPQALIAAREADGTLTRANFGAADLREHLWFRDRLLRRLAGQAEHLVLFPRPDVERTIAGLVGIDVSVHPDRVLVVGEGIDVAGLERVAREVQAEAPRRPVTTAALHELDALLATLPEGRSSLPLALSVGRLAPVKGMATLVSAWLRDPSLRRRCNLLVVGGNLDDPSPEEAAELSRIRDLVTTDSSAGAGLLLAGHRPNTTATTWLAAARGGRPGAAAPGGVYVCASLKEEFGIAILEAMTVGLVVVAPNGGGPATYVDDGVNGVLTHTANEPALAAAITRALGLSTSSGATLRDHRSRAVLRERFGIDTMAAALAEVYSAVACRDAGTPGPIAATP